LFLEGGYDLAGLTGSLVEVLRAFEGRKTPRPTGATSARTRAVLDETIAALSATWPGLA
jgi:hypothetical protein